MGRVFIGFQNAEVRGLFPNGGDAVVGQGVVENFSYSVNGMGTQVFQMYVENETRTSGFRVLESREKGWFWSLRGKWVEVSECFQLSTC